MKNKGYFAKRKAESNNKNKISKKIAIIVIIVLAVFIPTIIALVNYSINLNKPTQTDTVMSVTLYYNDELLYEEKDSIESANPSSLVKIFHGILTNKYPTEILPDGIENRMAFNAIVSQNDIISKYTCYFSSQENSNFIIDQNNNKIYEIALTDSQNFMASAYAERLYEDSMLPKLLTLSDDIIIPSSVNCKYHNIFGVELTATKIKTEQAELEYNMSGNLDLKFENNRTPDVYTIDIKKSGIPWKSGVTFEELPTLTVEPGMTLQFTVNASWNKTEGNTSFGDATYKFKVIVRDRAKFILNKTTVSVDDFVVVACTNIFDVDKIDLECKPFLYSPDYLPKFFEKDDVVYALIPFSDELQAGKYDMIFTYGASQQTITVELEKSYDKNNIYTVNQSNSEIFNNLISSATALGNVLNSLDSPEYIFFDSAFIDPTQNGVSVIHPYGTEFKTQSDSNGHYLEGIQYSLSNGATVQALNNGIVSYIGKADDNKDNDSGKYLGNHVIVEHGLGLRTIYAHLSDVNVSLGDAVAKGQSIGRSGCICDDAQEGVLVMCYIFDTPINYANLYGVSIPKHTIDD